MLKWSPRPTAPSSQRVMCRSSQLRIIRFAVLIAACTCVRAAADDSAKVAFFEKEVRPLLIEHCYECHSGSENNGGLLLDSRQAMLAGGDSGAGLVAGNADKSLVMEAVRYKNLELQMPPESKMSDREISVLEKWINDGAVDPRQPTSTSIQPTGMSIEAGRKFWSFRPIASLEVPKFSTQESWCNTPIDAFILQKLREQNLEPAPKADRQTLIRRVTFDLIGLPPSPEAIDAFVNNESSNAYAELVERLLASPQYGQRWGRHWLDVARYADSNGLDENLAFGTAWRYRDYVIDSFNEDKPFDQFVVEQLAGDLLAGANRKTKTATGFLALGAKVLAEPDREKLTMDTIDEQLDTVGKTFMGMTIGCARCHDHKFDPFQQADYYALAAIFKSSSVFGDTKTGAIKHWHEHDFTDEQELAEIKAIEAEIAAKKKAAKSFKSAAVGKLRNEARSKVVDYLVAATKFDPETPFPTVESIAIAAGLHPRILHHCRLHLSYSREQPFFHEWDTRKDDPLAVESFFQDLFERMKQAQTDAAKLKPPKKKLGDTMLEAARVALNDATGFLAVPPKPEFAFDAATLQEYYELMEKARVFESGARDATSAMGATDTAVLTSLPIHIRGSHNNLGSPVSREFPAVMRTSTVRPVFSSTQSGRLQFARWLVNTQHPLTARVYVNRIWRWHFGRGIVGSTENFGVLGDQPTHPELLDFLARQFMQSGWSTKALHRMILASSVYQMSSQPNKRSSESDPDNRLLSHFRMQRLEAEQIRDSLLVVSGRLDESMGGKSVPLRNRQFVFNHTSVDHTKYDSLRRSVYLPVIRNNVYSFFAQFDFPDPTMSTGNRETTTVAPQALLMLNADIVMESADTLAKELLAEFSDDDSRVTESYRRAFGRFPEPSEIDRAKAFLADMTSQSTPVSKIHQNRLTQAWSLFCQGLFSSNEFIYVR